MITTDMEARILDTDDRAALEELREDPRVDLLDTCAEQVAALRQLRPAAGQELLTEPSRWVYYPWRRTAVRVLGPAGFRAVRLDRNRNLITTDEQDRLGKLRVGVVGLSVGHVIAHTVAMQGLCGELRLADFDELELSNLNRVPSTLFDLGVNKATATARRIAEIDPYIKLRVLASGLTPETIDDFLDGLDIVVEECDSLDMKMLVRVAARRRGLPVVMATSDRGLVDIERFDLDPSRPIIHGLLGDLTDESIAALVGLDGTAKVPYVLRMVDAKSLSARGAASLVELGSTLATWPQLAGDVALGATAVAEAIRRIGLGEELGSGRVRIDVAKALDSLEDPAAVDSARSHQPVHSVAAEQDSDSMAVVDLIAAAAVRAPSGGNTQPWKVDTRVQNGAETLTLSIAPEHTAIMDVSFRASAVALGAAAFNARVAAAAHGVLGPMEITEHRQGSPLRACLRLNRFGDTVEDTDLAQLYEPMLRRETNRRRGTADPIAADVAESLSAAARREGARLQLVSDRGELGRAATVLAAADRIRYLTPRLHTDMVAELRWPGDASPETGIDVHTLEMDPGSLLALDILRRPDVMSHLAEWETGDGLGAAMGDRVRSGSALAVVTITGDRLTDYARGGSAVEAVWIAAQQCGLAVQPVSPVFLYARNDLELRKLSPAFSTSLSRLQQEFRTLTRTSDEESQVLVLRLCRAPAASLRSRRRGHRSGSY